MTKFSRGTERTLSLIPLVILGFMMCTIVLRLFTRMVIVKGFGAENAFVNAVFFDVDILKADTTDTYSTQIDWAALYPFSGEQRTDPEEENNGNQRQEGGDSAGGLKDRLVSFRAGVMAVEDKIHDYFSDYLVGYRQIVPLRKHYEKAAGWNYAPYAEYNGILVTDDGYLTGFYPACDVQVQAESVTSLARFCREGDMPFLCLQPPFKICKYEDLDLSGTRDFTNQNVDSFLSSLEENGVDVLDFRETLHGENLPHHALFYRTDHHWKSETGLWAARHILETLRTRYGLDTDPSALDSDSITAVEYPAWFLGSEGKKVTLAFTEPDDFSLLYPTYATSLRYEVDSLGIDCEGDFSILYNMACVEEKDYYNQIPYGAHIYGDQPLERIENLLSENSTRILIIHDSFGNCVVPFLALGSRYVDSLDIRHFTGSVRNFITVTQPDIVLILYHSAALNAHLPDESHTSLYDFR